MAWLIQNAGDGVVILADINLTFGPKQIKNLDLIGRINAERSNDLKCMLIKRTLLEIKKDASDEVVDPTVIQKLNEGLQAAQATAQKLNEGLQAAQATAAAAQAQNEELKKQNADLNAKMDSVLNEVKAFADKFPLQVRVIAEAMRNIEKEKVVVADRREEIKESGDTDAEIKTQDKILALKEKKLEKNIKDLGKTISKSSADDYQQSLDALDDLNL